MCWIIGRRVKLDTYNGACLGTIRYVDKRYNAPAVRIEID